MKHRYWLSFTLHVEAHFVKENKSFPLINLNKTSKETAVELSIYVYDFPINLSEKIVKIAEQRA